MTTLLLTENFPPRSGGTPRWFWELYGRADPRGLRVLAGEMSGDRDFDATAAMAIERVDLSFVERGYMHRGDRRRYRSAIRTVRDIVRRRGIDRIDCGRALPEGWIASRCGVPYRCFALGEELGTALTSRELTWMTRRALRHCQEVIACSHHTAKLLHRELGVPPENISVLHPGVDTEVFVPHERSQDVRERLGWGNRPVVLTVGRLQKRKGHDRAIDALGDLRHDFPEIRYAIVGDGEERESLERRARRAGVA